jgi:hypothetical protein
MLTELINHKHEELQAHIQIRELKILRSLCVSEHDKMQAEEDEDQPKLKRHNSFDRLDTLTPAPAPAAVESVPRTWIGAAFGV